MKPMPAKPRIIIAHVEGSGTVAIQKYERGVNRVSAARLFEICKVLYRIYGGAGGFGLIPRWSQRAYFAA
jgi:hypothetical protein